jgi:hypothetical protein
MNLQGFLAMRFKPRKKYTEPLPVVHGNMRRVIVVQPPDPMFTEAMFILKDDYFHNPGISRQELLKQAREAAGDYMAESFPTFRERPIFPTAMSVFALGAAAAVFAMWIGGII